MADELDPLRDLYRERLAGGVIGTGGPSIVLAEWTDRGGGGSPPLFIAPLHRHHEDDEAWYVLEGVLAVRLDDRDITVPAGGAIVAPRGTAHTYWNPQREPTRYVLAMSPRIHGLIEALHALSERNEAMVSAAFREYRSEYLGWP